jgi:hypothetical protein
MKIYADDSNIVFECPYCTLKEIIAPATSKRTFQRKLNEFSRVHDHQCKLRKERADKIDKSEVAVTDIIEK